MLSALMSNVTKTRDPFGDHVPQSGVRIVALKYGTSLYDTVRTVQCTVLGFRINE